MIYESGNLLMLAQSDNVTPEQSRNVTLWYKIDFF